MAKKYTVLIIPEGTRDVKRYKLPHFVLPVVLILFIGALGLAGYWFHCYQNIACGLPDIQALQNQNQRQEAQIQQFAEHLSSIKHQMARLRSFNQRLRVLANLEASKTNDDAFGMGGPEASAGGPGVRLASTVRERQLQAMRRDLDQLAAEGEAEQQVQRQLAKFLTERRSILASTPSIWPVRGWVTSGFGYRNSPFTGKRRFHAGLDISTRRGTPIKAPADGVVTFAGVEGSLGRMVVINHGHGLVTRYAHLKKSVVTVGKKVKRGELIGQVGNTGRSTGPHLHYEVLLSGTPTNPRNYILD